jgi:thiol-disulfide isomerase/thioredoxin
MSAGNLVPELLLKDLNGSRFKLSEQKGKYILLDFWASWCLPCRQEHPMLRKLHQELKNENIIFVSISMDTNDKSWRQAISNDHLIWIQLNDSAGMSGQIARRFGIKALPFNCIIDPEGKILGTKIRGKELENLMTKLFKK